MKHKLIDKRIVIDMGMTQNFYAVRKEDIIDDFDFRDNHGTNYGWGEFVNFSKDSEIYNWMHALWEKKVAASSSHGSNELDEEYLLLNEDDILQLEKDFHDKKLKFDHKDKQISIWKKD